MCKMACISFAVTYNPQAFMHSQGISLHCSMPSHRKASHAMLMYMRLMLLNLKRHALLRQDWQHHLQRAGGHSQPGLIGHWARLRLWSHAGCQRQPEWPWKRND